MGLLSKEEMELALHLGDEWASNIQKDGRGEEKAQRPTRRLCLPDSLNDQEEAWAWKTAVLRVAL